MTDVGPAGAGPRDPVVELWFDFASTYSYVAAMRAEEVAAAQGVRVAWRPFLLGPSSRRSSGSRTLPSTSRRRAGATCGGTWSACARSTASRGAGPRRFRATGSSQRASAASSPPSPWAPDFFRGVYLESFQNDRDIAAPEVVGDVLGRLGQDATALLARAAAAEAKAALRSATAAAAAQGFFGAPTFVAGGEIFFGQDRLEDAAAWCLRVR